MEGKIEWKSREWKEIVEMVDCNGWPFWASVTHTHLCNCASTAVFVVLTDLAVVIIIHSLLLFVTLKVSLCRCWGSEMSLAGTSS